MPNGPVRNIMRPYAVLIPRIGILGQAIVSITPDYAATVQSETKIFSRAVQQRDIRGAQDSLLNLCRLLQGIPPEKRVAIEQKSGLELGFFGRQRFTSSTVLFTHLRQLFGSSVVKTKAPSLIGEEQWEALEKAIKDRNAVKVFDMVDRIYTDLRKSYPDSELGLLFDHPSPLVRRGVLIAVELLARVGEKKMHLGPEFWKRQEKLIEYNLKDPNVFIQEQAIGELGDLVRLGVRDAELKLEDLIDSGSFAVSLMAQEQLDSTEFDFPEDDPTFP